MATNVDLTVCSIRKAFVFRVPPLAASTGHRASDWPSDAMWTGRCRVVNNGSALVINLEHTDKPGLFASCVVDAAQTNVEPVVDSSRYFVLRVVNGKGQRAFLGLGFESRDDAFDFKVALQDLAKTKAAAMSAARPAEPPMDFSLKGPIKIGAMNGANKERKENSADSANTTASVLSPSPSPLLKKKSRERKGDGKDQDAAAVDAADSTSCPASPEFDLLGISSTTATSGGSVHSDGSWATFD